jgi:hypothetical protein
MLLTNRDQDEHSSTPPDHCYPIATQLEYRLRKGEQVIRSGRGRTKTISTSNVVFESESALPVGMIVELDVSWPVSLDEKAGMKLCILGRTLRAEGDCTTIAILRHEFRTRTSHPSGKRGSTEPASPVGRTITASAS